MPGARVASINEERSAEHADRLLARGFGPCPDPAGHAPNPAPAIELTWALPPAPASASSSQGAGPGLRPGSGSWTGSGGPAARWGSASVMDSPFKEYVDAPLTQQEAAEGAAADSGSTTDASSSLGLAPRPASARRSGSLRARGGGGGVGAEDAFAGANGAAAWRVLRPAPATLFGWLTAYALGHKLRVNSSNITKRKRRPWCGSRAGSYQSAQRHPASLSRCPLLTCGHCMCRCGAGRAVCHAAGAAARPRELHASAHR